MAICGYEHSPHDMTGFHPHRPRQPDDNWAGDLFHFAFDLEQKIEAFEAAVDEGGAS